MKPVEQCTQLTHRVTSVSVEWVRWVIAIDFIVNMEVGSRPHDGLNRTELVPCGFPHEPMTFVVQKDLITKLV